MLPRGPVLLAPARCVVTRAPRPMRVPYAWTIPTYYTLECTCDEEREVSQKIHKKVAGKEKLSW